MLKLAKSKMEHEEGMNYLWIRIPSPKVTANKVRIEMNLPEGVFRSTNLNGYAEDEFGTILIDEFRRGQDVFIEFYTQNPISCGEVKIDVIVGYYENKLKIEELDESIPLILACAEELDDLIIDEEVVERLKDLSSIMNQNKENKDKETQFIIFPPQVIQLEKQISELERKYRIDFKNNDWRYPI